MIKRTPMNARYFALTTLSASILLLSESSYALQILQDNDLRQIEGQDGIDVTISYTQADFNKLYWEDKAGTATGVAEQLLRATANTVKIRDTNAGDGLSLGARYKVDIGSNGTKTGVALQMVTNPFTMSVDDFSICDTSLACDPSGASGAYNGKVSSLAVQADSAIDVTIKTADGLFNKNDQASLHLGLQNLNIFTGLKLAPAATTQNQLILKNFNFNFDGVGVMYIDATKGFMIETSADVSTGVGKATKSTSPSTTHGYIDFTRVTDPDQTGAATGTYGGKSAGLNLELMTKANADMTLPNPYSLTNAKGLIRLGASGRMVNSYLQLRGVSTNGLAAPTDNNTTNTHILNNILGFASNNTTTGTGAENTVIGSNGVLLHFRGEFTAKDDAMLGGDNTKATTLELGGAGTNTFGFEFGELQPLVSGSADRAYFDSGDIYFNLVNTRHLRMPENSVLRTSRFGGTTNTFLTDSSDYVQQVHNFTNNPYSLVTAIRGSEFQALSKRGRFTSSSGVSAGNAIAAGAGVNNKWGLGLPFYNLNANIALYSSSYTGTVYSLDGSNNVTSGAVANTQRLGLALALSTEGKNSDGSKTTSIMVIDGGDNPNNLNKPTDYYIGLRNIDMLLRGYGSVGFENGNLNINLPDLLMVMSAEIAAGYLPGAKYKTGAGSAPANNFNLKQDVLFGLKVKLLGDMNFALVPNNEISGVYGSRLSIVGRYNLTAGTVQVSDPIDDSIIGFDNMSGLIQFNNAIVINKDDVSFNYSFDFNPDHDPAKVFRVRDINFYPPAALASNRGQRLGEMVMTGGRLSAAMSIKPRN
ncbi:hypothetical protein FK216_10490 [Moraxellaceae bacterium AER2_44_116]|nr:hypothetical protein [Moraxellaceae bacterium]TQC96994.1 hypothetical protein FK216_10490 [Moraxellaceae bacterium AER2_44_116]